MTPLQKTVHYLIIAEFGITFLSFVIAVLSFVNIKPDLSHFVDDYSIFNERKEEICDRQDSSK